MDWFNYFVLYEKLRKSTQINYSPNGDDEQLKNVNFVIMSGLIIKVFR